MSVAIAPPEVETFDAFYTRTRDRLALHVAALTGDPIEALDHVQEAYIRAWSRWGRVGDLDDPEGWVRRVAYNLAVSRWRRARRLALRGLTPRTEPSTQSALSAPSADWDDEQGRVLTALAELSVRHREALVLHHLVGLPVRDVARELGAAEGTVKSWLFRGRQQLAQALADDEQKETGDD